MEKINDFDKVEEAGESVTLKAGPYVCTILNVTDVKEKEYLNISFDINSGEFKDYFRNIYLAQKKRAKETDVVKWRGTFVRSYKEKALSFFKGFITAVEKSNTGYKWNWDEKTLKGKIVVLNFREEEYINSKGNVAVIAKPFEPRSLEAYKKGEIKIADRSTLEDQGLVGPQGNSPAIATQPVAEVDDDKLPF